MFGRYGRGWVAEPEPAEAGGVSDAPHHPIAPVIGVRSSHDGHLHSDQGHSDQGHSEQGHHDHPQDCGCAACEAQGEHTAAATAGELAAADTRNDLPSYDWDEAAEQIGRDDRVFGTSNGGFSFGSHLGRGATITYGFLAEADTSTDEGGRDYQALSTAEIAAVETALARISAVADIEFVRVTGASGPYLDDPNDAQIDLEAIAGSNGGLARTAYSGNALLRSTVSIGERGLETEGSYAFRTALHEVSHALGLSHPGDYDGGGARSYEASAEFREDSAQFSVMSYWDESATGAGYGSAHAAHLMLYDVAAIQRLYGANETAQAGDDVYGTGATDAAWSMDGGAPVGAIWDTGGHDRIDGSGYGGAQRIDLREEAFSSLGGLTHNVAIARGAGIEDATGGQGDDALIGNALANTLIGGAGDDLITGGAGADVIYGDGLV